MIVDIETKDPLLRSRGASWVFGLGYIVGISIKVDNEPAEYYPLKHQNEQCFEHETVRRYLMDIPRHTAVVGHYLQYDAGWLYNSMGWLHNGPLRCTLILSQLRNNTYPSFSLDNRCRDFGLGQKISIGKPTDIWKLPINTVAMYANHDVELTARLDDFLWKERDSEPARRECGIIPILVKMKKKGIKIDLDRLNELQHYFHTEYTKTTENLSVKNIWASSSVYSLFHRLHITPPRTREGNPSFTDEVLETFSHVSPEIEALRRARKIHKLINTFCTGIRSHIADDGHIHPDFYNGRSDDGGTVTGRLSAANPGVHQIPHRTKDGMLIRSVFVAGEGIWYKFDYKQQEPVLMLHYASRLNLPGIQKWRNIYESSDADFYTPIQEMMSIPRQMSKTLTLAFCYNMGADTLARRAKIGGNEAMQYIRRFNHALPWLGGQDGLKAYCIGKAETNGYIKTIGGRHLYFNRHTANDALNYLAQGGSADQKKEAMLQIYEKLGLVPMIDMHDEFGYGFTEEMFLEEKDKEISEIMSKAFVLDFPSRIDATYGNNWMDCG